MALIQFVQNYQDLSTDRGFQFKFHCDKCGNGYMTRFQTSTFGVAEAALGIASNLFGGLFNEAHNAEFAIQRAVGGKAHDAALNEAVTEGKTYFHQCARCGHWVCPEVCWNGEASMCKACAPQFESEMAAAHAQAKVDAARSQLSAAAAKENYVAGVDMSAGAVLRAPGSPAVVQPVNPPAAVAAAEAHCTACGAGLSAGVKFCPQCGLPRAAPGCPGCQAAVQPGTKFCGQCGHKFG
jgi:hypothetical protein